MKILFIYRHPNMGFSIGKVFKPIEQEMRKYGGVDVIYLPIPNYKPRGLWKNIRCAIKAVKHTKYDVVHITGTEHYLLPFLKRQNTIVTVHDLGFYTNKPLGIRSVWKYIGWIWSLKYAKKITFISDKSKEEASRFIHFRTNQVCIIYNPVGKEYIYYNHNFNMEKPCILHIGTKSNKNLVNSILALKNLPCHFRIVGKLSQEILVLLNENKIDYSNAFNLTDEEILKEYLNCDIVSFPSLYEGFGMPIIEGQSVGRVVVTSNLSPMKEIAGNSAILVDPKNIESI